jgi:hypothetical protein
VDPPAEIYSWLAGAILIVTVVWHAVAHARHRREIEGTNVDLGLFSALVVATYCAVLHLPGGLDGAFYPLIYVLVMASAAYSRPSSAVATVFFAGLLELGLRAIALGERDFPALAPRMGFLVLFTGLNVILFRGEIARVRRISRNHIVGELSRLREAARS